MIDITSRKIGSLAYGYLLPIGNDVGEMYLDRCSPLYDFARIPCL